MAAYIPVPRDLTRVKSKVFFNLTKRQLICFGAAALIGVPLFFLLKSSGNVSLAALGMIKRANETGNIYESDIRDLQERLEEIWTDMKEVLVRLSSIQ